MKTTKLLAPVFFVLTVSIGVTVAAGLAFKPIDFEKIYIPNGFDSNDNVEIMGEGLYEKTCYRKLKTEIQVDIENHVIHIGPVGHETPSLCLQLVTPFQKTIEIGRLEVGHWKVSRMTDEQVMGDIEIGQSEAETVDSLPYAPVTQVKFKRGHGSIQILLTGTFPSECMQLEDVQISVQPDVIVVKPLAKVDQERECDPEEVPFRTWAAIDFLEPKRYLVHVRTMHGASINTLVDVD